MSLARGGITLWPRGGTPSEFTIAIDSTACNQGDGLDLVWRLYLFAHEFEHVLIEAAQHEERDLFVAESFRQEFENFAEIMLDEARADRFAAWACGQVLRCGEDGRTPVSLADLIGVRMAHSALTLCEKLCDFVLDVQHYRSTTLGFDELLPRASKLLNELYIVLAHTIALYDSDKRIQDLTQVLSESPGFRTYLKEDWDLLVQLVCNGDVLAARGDFPGLLERTLSKLGLRAEQMSDGGLHLHVHEPLVCEEEVAE